ncbi:MAG TPA: hypothetical protein VEC93_02125, partial [Anaerolineae bacterium]|nr:hypothetical protein [Anaerolineae bacterium]
MSKTARYTTLILSLLAGLTLLLPNARDAYAATRTVCASGCDFTTIQAAINASVPGDTIRVNPGTYNENLDLTTMGTGGNLAIVKNGAGTVTIGGTGIKLRNSGAFAFNLTLDGLTFTSTSNNVVIQLNGLAGLTFVNNIVNGTGSDFNSHHDLQLTLSSGSGAYTIVNNTFNANGIFGDGLRVSVSGGSPSFTIEGNTFNGGSGPAMTY